MSTLAKIILGLLAIPLLYLGSGFVYETWNSASYRYRLTYEVEVDGKVQVGSGVIEASLGRSATWVPQSGGAHSGARGQAVMVDLGSRGVMFSLLSSPNYRARAENIVHANFPPERGVATAALENTRRYQVAGLKKTLAFDQLPTLVRFRDLKDPMTVEKVDPNDLAKSFGSGVVLRRVTLETVDVGWWPLNSIGLSGEAVARGIEMRLPWLARLNGGYLHGGSTSRGAPLELHAGDFATLR
jgi:hypothetical protein